MRTIARILKTELKVFFYSPIAWLILLVFAFQVGAYFCSLYEDGLRYQEIGYNVYMATSQLICGTRGLFLNMLDNLYLYIPLLTMGLMSREYSNGSIKLLYSSPVSNTQIIIGKYLATIIYGLLLVVVMSLPTVFIVFYVQDPDIMMMVVAAFGVFITICAYSAIGLFLSTITPYQVVAVISTLIVLAILNFIGKVGQEYDFIRDVTFWLSIAGRSKVFLEGMLCTREIFYFLLVIFMFLSLSVLKLRGERLKQPLWKKTLQYMAVLCVVIGFGIVSSQPKFIKYYDATYAKINTLTPYSQEVMKRITDGLTITTYANILDETWFYAEPRNRNYDLKRFEKYLRFKPEIKQKYVYYYGDFYSNPRYEGDNRTPREMIQDICRWTKQDTNAYIPQEAVWAMDDISKEGGRMVRVLSRDNGRKAILRVFEDDRKHPSETEITAAMKKLVDKPGIAGFVIGHGERSVNDKSETGYEVFTANRVMRYSMINQGFEIREISLEKPVPIDVDFIVISDVKRAFSEAEMLNYKKFLDRGGNLMILGENRRQENMNPLILPLNLKYGDNILVNPNDVYTDDIITTSFTQEAVAVYPAWQYYIDKGLKVTMPSACAIEKIGEPQGFVATDLLVSDVKGVWEEVDTRDFTNEKSQLNIEKGEVEKQYTLATMLTRDVKGKKQTIFVTGDADLFTLKEFNANRIGVRSANINLLTECLYALTDYEYPINIQRKYSTDTRYTASHNTLLWMNLFYKWVIPAIILILCVYILVSRKRK